MALQAPLSALPLLARRSRHVWRLVYTVEFWTRRRAAGAKCDVDRLLAARNWGALHEDCVHMSGVDVSATSPHVQSAVCAGLATAVRNALAMQTWDAQARAAWIQNLAVAAECDAVASIDAILHYHADLREGPSAEPDAHLLPAVAAACKHGQVRALERLLADRNVRVRYHGATWMRIAVDHRQMGAVRCLLSNPRTALEDTWLDANRPIVDGPHGDDELRALWTSARARAVSAY